MVGPEILSTAGKAASPLLSRLAAKLAHSLLFRYQVQRTVRKKTGIALPGRAFRRWLRRVAEVELKQPIEETGVRLARDLDATLSVYFEWAVQRDRLSKSVAIVESVYDSVLALSPDPEARVLQASWSSSRHSALVARLMVDHRSLAGLSRQDAAALLRRYSGARRSVRLSAFHTDVDALNESLSGISGRLPQVPSGEVRVLVAPFGAGKSEVAEAWHLAQVDVFDGQPDSPQPVWVDAAELTDRSLEEVLVAIADRDLIRTSGVAVVIDGLDEVDGERAVRLVDQAKVVATASPRCSFLLTCRPGVIAADSIVVDWPGLTTEEAVRLITAVAGTEPSTWSWDPILLDTISRPFFALAVGVSMKAGRLPTGQAELIRLLVERALADAPTSALAVTDASRYLALRQLGENLTDSGGQADGLDFRTRALARETTLVRARTSGAVEFSLPIFQQWFAAQSLLEQPLRVRQLSGDPLLFDRWRWAIAVACLAADDEHVDSILAACFAGNPGAAAWVIARIAEGHDWRSETAIDESQAGVRVLRATRACIDAIGELAPLYFPVRSSTQPITLGVRARGSILTLGWRLKAGSDDEVVDLPSSVHPLQTGVDRTEWLPDRSGPIPEGGEWPWRIVQERFAGQTIKILETHPKLGPRFGIWHVESMYAAARQLGSKPTMMFNPIPVTEIRAAAGRFLSVVDNPRSAAYQTGRSVIPGQLIVDLMDWLSELDLEELRRPLPAPDVDPAQSTGWVWGLYSDAQMQAFYAEAYGQACVAYDEAVSSVFASFSWSMGAGADGEFGVVGDLSYKSGTSFGARAPGITTARVPISQLAEIAAQFGENAKIAANGRALITRSADDRKRSWIHELARNRQSAFVNAGPFSRPGGVADSIANRTDHSRPASELAANWLCDDMKALGLAQGTFPQLDR